MGELNTVNQTPDLYGELVAIAMTAARAAVALIHDNRPSELRVDTKSSATDHVTEMDRASERLIRATILAARPSDAIVGEEDEANPVPTEQAQEGDVTATWYVDPIDGTTNYVYDHPGYNVSIAAEVEGQVVAAVVADPTHGRMYSATLGGGAFCNDRRLLLPGVSSTDEATNGPGTGGAARVSGPLAGALVATGFGYSPKRRERQGRVVAELLPQIRDIRRMGAAAVDLCSVASGRVDAYFEVGLAIWDLAAGQLIATEAGARVGPIDGGPALPGSVLACRADLFDPMQQLLSSLGAGRV